MKMLINNARKGKKQNSNYLDTRKLFGSSRSLDIKHNNEFYRLQLTKAGKLILTK